tara:strand:+ start:394 stop:1785 length:1392 start_codon:yes stop_codon:yes gene_type:complete
MINLPLEMANLNKNTNYDSSLAVDKFIRSYRRSKKSIQVDFRKLVPNLTNPDRATHFLHSYPAKLLVHIPIFFLSNELLSKPHGVVLDPFSGSGTVMLEASMANRQALGAESNPFARLLSEVKSTPLDTDSLNLKLSEILNSTPPKQTGPPPQVVNIEKWFYPHISKQLQRIRIGINNTSAGAEKKFFELCLAKCAEKVSLADPRISVPVRLNLDKYPEGNPHRDKIAKHFRKLKRINVIDLFSELATKNIRRMDNLRTGWPAVTQGRLISDDAKNLFKNGDSTGLSKNSVDLIITSPPYPGAQKYIRSSTFGLGWLGLCPPNEMMNLKRSTIGREEYRNQECDVIPLIGIAAIDNAINRVRDREKKRAAVVGYYLHEMKQSISEMYQALKDEGHLVLISSNNQIAGRNFPTAKYLRLLCEEIGFETKFVLVDQISSRGLMTKRNKTAGIITREYVLLCQKTK